MKDLNIRRYKSGDEKKIVTLFQEVWGKPMGKTESIKHWNWKYKNNPNDRMEILLAINENKIVGHYAVIPVKMKIKKEVFITSLSLDTMTHKDYRGKGIFPTLAKGLYADLGETGIPITYGFPNAYSVNGFIKKCDWIEISDLPIYILPLNFITLSNRYLKIKFLSNLIGNILNFLYNLFLKVYKIPDKINIEKIKKFDKTFDNLWELVKDEIIIGVIRDSKYLNWRYFQKPEGDYIVFAIKVNDVLKGYIILKIEERFDLKIGLIIDILTDPSNMAYQDYLINYAIFYFKNKNVDLVSTIMFPHWRYYKSLKRYKFIKMIKHFFPEEIYFGARRNNDKFDFQIIKNPKNWYLTWGDTDVV